MKVVVINDFAHIEGGASHVAVSSAIGLASKGHQVTFISAVGPVSQELRLSKVNVVCTGQYDIARDANKFRAGLQGLWNLKAAQAFKQVIQESDASCTIVHIHGWTKALSSSVVRAAIASKSRVICTLNDYFTACPNGGFFNYPDRNICTLRPLSVACLLSQCDKRSYSHKLWRVGRQLVQKHIASIPADIEDFITVSGFSEEILMQFLPPQARVHRNGNIVNIPKRDPVAVEKNSTFVMLGRLSEEKGPRVLAEAASRLNCQTLYVGDGDCRRELLECYPGVQITGWQQPTDVIGHLQQARALAFPSLWYEAQPIAVLEASALGIPSIVADSCSARESVIDGMTGLWFRSGDQRDLANKMRIMQDADVAKKLGRAAYDLYWSNPSSLEVHISRLEKIYGEMLLRRSNAPSAKSSLAK